MNSSSQASELAARMAKVQTKSTAGKLEGGRPQGCVRLPWTLRTPRVRPRSLASCVSSPLFGVRGSWRPTTLSASRFLRSGFPALPFGAAARALSAGSTARSGGGGIRTLTGDGLSALPLPVGLRPLDRHSLPKRRRSRGWPGETRTWDTVTAQFKTSPFPSARWRSRSYFVRTGRGARLHVVLTTF